LPRGITWIASNKALSDSEGFPKMPLGGRKVTFGNTECAKLPMGDRKVALPRGVSPIIRTKALSNRERLAEVMFGPGHVTLCGGS